MANRILPDWTAEITPGLRSNVPTFVPFLTALSAVVVTSGLRPRKASVCGFALKYAAIFCCVPGRSDVAFGITSVFVVPLNVFFAPAARCVRPELLASWMTTTRFLAPAAACAPHSRPWIPFVARRGSPAGRSEFLGLVTEHHVPFQLAFASV